MHIDDVPEFLQENVLKYNSFFTNDSETSHLDTKLLFVAWIWPREQKLIRYVSNERRHVKAITGSESC